MSAKVFYHKTPYDRPVLSPIPTEIWIRVMEYAGQSGLGLYESNMTSPRAFGFIRANEKQETKDLRSSLNVRSRMSRVSKAWCAMSRPLLYQYIHLKKARGIESLLNSLQSTSGNGSQGCALGWWTKRLDINLCDNEYDEASMLRHLDHIAALVGFLPRLEILTFSTTAHGYNRRKSSQILDSLSCRESLKAVIWYTNSLTPSVKSWTDFLERHDQLEMLRGPLAIEPTNRVQLNRLKLLHPLLFVVYPQNPSLSINLTQVDLPALKWIAYEVEQRPTVRSMVFDRLGDKLAAVQLVCYTETIHTTIARDHFTPVLDKMRDTCHNLQQINLVLRSWPSIQSLQVILHMPTSVTTLGIRTLRSQISKSDLKQLLHDALPAVQSRNPNLAVVQLLDQANTEQFYAHLQTLEDGVQKLKGLGITLQDHNGQNLTPKIRHT